MNPIAKRLPLHPAGLRRLMPAMAIQNHGDRKNTQPLFGVPRQLRRRAKLLDAQLRSRRPWHVRRSTPARAVPPRPHLQREHPLRRGDVAQQARRTGRERSAPEACSLSMAVRPAACSWVLVHQPQYAVAADHPISPNPTGNQ
jgi:hypothetical protein